MPVAIVVKKVHADNRLRVHAWLSIPLPLLLSHLMHLIRKGLLSLIAHINGVVIVLVHVVDESQVVVSVPVRGFN